MSRPGEALAEEDDFPRGKSGQMHPPLPHLARRASQEKSTTAQDLCGALMPRPRACFYAVTTPKKTPPWLCRGERINMPVEGLTRPFRQTASMASKSSPPQMR